MAEVSVETTVGAGGPDRPGILEILDRSGQVLQRIPYRGGSLRIGRAYDNDVIVGDPFVNPHHLLFSWHEGRPLVEDLGSVNGTWCRKGRKRITREGLSDGEMIQLGHSQLRYLPADATVAPAWRDTARHGLLSLFGRPWMLPLTAILCAMGLALDKLLDSTRNLGPGELANQLVYPLLGVMLWAGFWSLLNRLIAHRSNFAVHLGIATLAVAGLVVNAQGAPLLCFAFGWDGALPWLKNAGQIVILAAALFAHMQYATHGRTWVQAGGSIALAFMLFGSPLLGDLLQRDEFSSLPRIQPLLKPPGVRLVRGESLENFLREAESLRQRVEEAVEE
jgi:hypothetical protein